MRFDLPQGRDAVAGPRDDVELRPERAEQLRELLAQQRLVLGNDGAWSRQHVVPAAMFACSELRRQLACGVHRNPKGVKAPWEPGNSGSPRSGVPADPAFWRRRRRARAAATAAPAPRRLPLKRSPPSAPLRSRRSRCPAPSDEFRVSWKVSLHRRLHIKGLRHARQRPCDETPDRANETPPWPTNDCYDDGGEVPGLSDSCHANADRFARRDGDRGPIED